VSARTSSRARPAPRAAAARAAAATEETVALIVTCEHGGNDIPPAYRPLFAGFDDVLASHRGWDPGALQLARDVARGFAAPLVAATVSRLVIELNRSPRHPSLYSERTRTLAPAARAQLLAEHYAPYRDAVEQHVRTAAADGARVFHLSCHSFTPMLQGVVRQTDIGLLYDARRAVERRLCGHWAKLLAPRIAPLRVRRNYPYRGHADGLTTYLRRRFPEASYAGVEIEVNQKYPLAGGRAWSTLRRQIVHSLADLLAVIRTPSTSPWKAT